MKKNKENGCLIFYPDDTPLTNPQIETKRKSARAEENTKEWYYKNNLLAMYRLVEIKRLDPEEVKKRRAEYMQNKAIIVRALMKELAKTGQMKGLFKAHEIDNASKGIQPKGYEVHHIIPLSLGGTNEPANLMLVEESADIQLHSQVHERIWNPIRDSVPYLPEGHKDLAPVFVWLIELPRIMTREDEFLLCTQTELEERESQSYATKQTKNAFRKQGSVNCMGGWLPIGRFCARQNRPAPQNRNGFSRQR